MSSSLDYTYLYIYTLQRNCRGEFSLDFRSSYPEECKGKVFYGHGASQWRIYYHRMWVQLSTTCSNLQKQPNGDLLVAVNHNQLPTMASETVDPIDWSHPPPYTGQYPLSSTCCTLQCGLGCKSQDLLHLVNRERATFGMPDQRTACAATQGIVRVPVAAQCVGSCSCTWIRVFLTSVLIYKCIFWTRVIETLI